jgi:hypothetical protein
MATESGSESSSPPVAPQPAAPPEANPASAPTSPSPDVSSISRQVLRRVIGLGAQQFIRLIRVRASFRSGRFFGWRVIAYNGPGPIRPGDIVRKVNGRPIERPDQFMAVWNTMGKVSELVVALHRSGKPTTLRYPIID